MASCSSSDECLAPLTNTLLDTLLAEDVPFGDLTTRALGIGKNPGVMTFAARHEQVVCCTEDVAALLTRLGADAEIVTGSGTRVASGQLLLRASGSAGALHLGWKVAQTLLEWAAGIATETNDIVLAARAGGNAPSAGVAIACSRKAPPLTRAVAVRAVQAGGGIMHRTGLSDTILVFAEHLAFMDPCGGLDQAISRLRANAPERRIVIEVCNAETAMAAARAGAEALQLEKFTPEELSRLRASLAAAGLSPRIVAAGGINARNVDQYVKAGADIIVTSAPYAAKPRDVQVEIGPA
ncbi:ModD protein [Komagataeibacter kakiaceti JCM 25156]